MLKLGVTGGIGSGKSTVSKLLDTLGIPVYIADIESKKLTSTSPVIRKKLIEAFGENLYEGNTLNKMLLASIIFNDKEKLQTANSIIHPEVIKDFFHWTQKHESCSIVAHESAILFESGINNIVDKTIMVYAPIDIRIARVMQRDGSSKEKIQERINSQMPDEDKLKLSDFVITNDETESLISQTLNLLKKLNYNTII